MSNDAFGTNPHKSEDHRNLQRKLGFLSYGRRSLTIAGGFKYQFKCVPNSRAGRNGPCGETLCGAN